MMVANIAAGRELWQVPEVVVGVPDACDVGIR